MQGRFDEARARFAEGLAILEQLGMKLRLATRRTLSGAIELLADDPVAAERELRWALERLQAMDEHGDLPGIAAQLAEALYRQGRYKEAELFAKLSEAEKYARMRWRGPWAKLLARRGEFGKAEEAARSVVADAAASDNLNMQGAALMDLAEVLQLSGRHGEAAEPLQEAVRVFTKKGNVVAAAKAQAVLDEMPVSA
jgi:tetratricopeptide (TPR) repeat protein